MNTLNILLLAATFSLSSLQLTNRDKQVEKIKTSRKVLSEFSQLKGRLPAKLIRVTQGVVIIPKLTTAGMGLTGKHGKGIAIVKNADGSWSQPVFVSLTGGSLGLQAGVQSVDLVLVFTNRKPLTNLMTQRINLGGDVSVAAGHFGRNVTAATDVNLEAELYSYSKAKGFFAGIGLSGSVLSLDEKATRTYYQQPLGNTWFNPSGQPVSKAIPSPEAIALQQTMKRLFE